MFADGRCMVEKQRFGCEKRFKVSGIPDYKFAEASATAGEVSNAHYLLSATEVNIFFCLTYKQCLSLFRTYILRHDADDGQEELMA